MYIGLETIFGTVQKWSLRPLLDSLKGGLNVGILLYFSEFLDVSNPIFDTVSFSVRVSKGAVSGVLTLKAPRKILEHTTIYFCFLFFRENNAWHYIWIVCPADDSHVMSSIIPSEKCRLPVVIGALRVKFSRGSKMNRRYGMKIGIENRKVTSTWNTYSSNCRRCF